MWMPAVGDAGRSPGGERKGVAPMHSQNAGDARCCKTKKGRRLVVRRVLPFRIGCQSLLLSIPYSAHTLQATARQSETPSCEFLAQNRCCCQCTRRAAGPARSTDGARPFYLSGHSPCRCLHTDVPGRAAPRRTLRCCVVCCVAERGTGLELGCPQLDGAGSWLEQVWA